MASAPATTTSATMAIATTLGGRVRFVARRGSILADADGWRDDHRNGRDDDARHTGSYVG